MIIVFWLVFTLLWWCLLLISFRKDRSRYRNCYFLFFALISLGWFSILAAGSYQKQVILFTFAATVVSLLLVPVFLIHNGIVMYRKEGHSLSNLLSLLLGVSVGIGELATAFFVLAEFAFLGEWVLRYHLRELSIASAVISVSVIYMSVSFLIFMIYSVFLMIIPKKKDFDYVIIHGAGLLDGDRVSKLLSDRLDKAVDVYRRDPTPPIMIPSGGKGEDETISEAEAMGRYLIEKDVPRDKIILEDKSATTYENIRNSKQIIDSMEGRKYTALVTSNYHVYRALRYCRKNGLKCTGIGSRVALYFWPSALIREFIAVHSEKKHLISFVAGWLMCIAIPVYLLA